MRELELELAEVHNELKWTRRAVALLVALQGGDILARAQPWFPP